MATFPMELSHEKSAEGTASELHSSLLLKAIVIWVVS